MSFLLLIYEPILSLGDKHISVLIQTSWLGNNVSLDDFDWWDKYRIILKCSKLLAKQIKQTCSLYNAEKAIEQYYSPIGFPHYQRNLNFIVSLNIIKYRVYIYIITTTV